MDMLLREDRRPNGYWMLLALLLAASTPAAAQNIGQQPPESPAQPASPGGMDLLRQAYQATRSAQSEQDFTAILDTVAKAAEGSLNEAEQRYADSLSAWAHNRRGEALAAAGQEEQALADFEQAVELDPSRFHAVHNRGVSLGILGKFDEALADFNRVIELKPDHAKAYYNRGELRFRQGDLAGAIADYNQAIRLSPRDAGALNSRGFAHYRQGDYQNAVRDYTQAIRLDSNHAEAYVNRGDAYADQAQFAQAIRDYLAAIQVNPEYARAYQSAAWFRATCPVAQFRNTDLALRSANRAIELEGEATYRHLDTLAAAHANAGQFDLARDTQSKAITLATEAGVPPDVLERLEQRAALYAQDRPYRDVQPGAVQPQQ